MRKMILAAMVCVLLAGTTFAVDAPTEEDYKNLEELRVKLGRMRREMDKFMKEVVATYPVDAGKWDQFGSDVRVDVSETKEAVLVKVDLPGMDKDKIDISLERGKMLRISGERDVLKNETSPGVVVKERMQGRFERQVELPSECMSEGIKADYANGVLDMVIPKKKPSTPETVKIKVD